jgi:hypothetical protein
MFRLWLLIRGLLIQRHLKLFHISPVNNNDVFSIGDTLHNFWQFCSCLTHRKNINDFHNMYLILSISWHTKPPPVLCSEAEKACSSSRRLPMAGPPSAAEVKSGLSRPGLEPRAVRHSRMSMAKPHLLTAVSTVADLLSRSIDTEQPPIINDHST